MNIQVVMPVYNDFASAVSLLADIDRAMSGRSDIVHFMLVDDGSVESPQPLGILAPDLAARVRVLSLRANVGHQRAIAIGLCQVHAEGSSDVVVVMDSDGEDAATDVPRLLDALLESQSRSVVFAERTRRSEGIVFMLGYTGYRVVHRWLTGVSVRFGNFSALPTSLLERLVVNADLWNHYAACVLVSRVPFTSLPTRRANRYTGMSTMNFISLVTHGLSAIAVFGDRVGTRLLVLLGAVFCFAVAGLGAVVAIRFGTDLATPGWATMAFGVIVVVALQLLLLAGLSALALLRSRHSAAMIPVRDFVHFVAGWAPMPRSEP